MKFLVTYTETKTVEVEADEKKAHDKVFDDLSKFAKDNVKSGLVVEQTFEIIKFEERGA